jgi:hypothetical protein
MLLDVLDALTKRKSFIACRSNCSSTGCFKKSFKTLKVYLNLFRDLVHILLGVCLKSNRCRCTWGVKPCYLVHVRGRLGRKFYLHLCGRKVITLSEEYRKKFYPTIQRQIADNDNLHGLFSENYRNNDFL